MRPLPVLGALFVAAGAGALSLGAALRDDNGAARDAARSALVVSTRAQSSGATSAPPHELSARYWWSLAGFEHAVGPGNGSRSERTRRLTAVAAELTRLAGRGQAPSRSLSLSLLGLTRLVEGYLSASGPGHGEKGKSAASALRAAVVLDAANNDAKANLELLLQTRHARKGKRPKDQGQGHKPARGSQPQSGSRPAPGAGRSAEGPPVGY